MKGRKSKTHAALRFLAGHPLKHTAWPLPRAGEGVLGERQGQTGGKKGPEGSGDGPSHSGNVDRARR